jgi:UDP-glucose:(heptosyl)LPS alpha-1,3-glucosyltransferase
MRIAIVVHDYHRQGGHSRYAVELAERFSVNDEVHVLANTFPAGSTLAPAPALAGRRLYFHHIAANRRTALGTVLTFCVPATLALRRLGPFDVIHAQGFVCLQRSLVTAHICIAAWHEQRLQSGHGVSWKERFFDSVVMRIERWLYRRQGARPLIAISRRVQEDLARFYGSRQAAHVIPHGVDTREFDVSRREPWRTEIRGRLGIEEKSFCALWVGDLRKGVKTAIEAVARNPGAVLLAVSRTDPDEFRRASERLGAADRIRFVPPTNEIAKFYAAADVLLFPTTYDAFGMVVLEAMAMGTPVIVSRGAGAAEVIEPGQDGLWLEDPFEAGHAAAQLRSLEQDASARARLAESGLAKVRKLTWDRVAAETYAVYREWTAAPPGHE